MLIDSLLFVLSAILRIILIPLEALNFTVDFVSSIPFVTQFFQVIAYIVPWTNFVPLFVLVVGLLGIKIVISLLRAVKGIVPFL